jgi:hypothetical protein
MLCLMGYSMIRQHLWTKLVAILLFFMFSSCAFYPAAPQWQDSIVYTGEDREDVLYRNAPVFVAEEADQKYNRIGTPVAEIEHDQEVVKVDSDVGAIYTSVRHFSTQRGEYTNIIYRVHFSEVPLHYLGAGKNVGLLVVVTLDDKERPLLYTLLHTCGCYLAFIPTSYLPESSWKKDWKPGRQGVYGENLPSYLEFSGTQQHNLIVHLRPGTHRAQNVWLMAGSEVERLPLVRLQLYPFEALEQLQLSDGSTTSFYETSGARKGYVKESYKIWERLFISWWAFDWRVGEDKKLGSSLDDGTVFYTSLKPWAREESDLRDFPRFLRYWGWQL